MRKIDQQTANAFLTNGKMSSGNTVVSNGVVTLHGSDIAQYINDSHIRINFAGYPTNVTKSRINAIVRQFSNSRYIVSIEKGKIYLSCEYKPSVVISDNEWIDIVRDWAVKV
tara:strand:+ start:633 stop:968 length:336 start_codon:yes stop_codon:yes gene_type:complete